jgi:glycerate kinase
MAAASGLPLLAPHEYDPRITSSRGTGDLIRAALDAGMRRIVLGIGGSASNDGGVGMARALGARFLDHDDQELPDGGAALARLARIDLSMLASRLRETEITVACDVDNPLCGPYGASAVFGPQKGATPAMIAELDAALARFSALAEDLTGRVISARAGAGAAGGLGAGLMFFTPAKLRPGIDLVLDTIGFEEAIADADLVMTGEGRTDAQTAFGKAPVGVARRAKRFGVPVICLSGSLGEGAGDLLACGIDALESISEGPMTLEESMSSATRLIESASARLCRLIVTAKNIRCQ